jgi:hypothetical protein
MHATLTRDSDLVSESEIFARLLSIRRQREIINNAPEKRVEHIESLRKKWAKCAKLTEREDLLCGRLRVIRKLKEASQ